MENEYKWEKNGSDGKKRRWKWIEVEVSLIIIITTMRRAYLYLAKVKSSPNQLFTSWNLTKFDSKMTMTKNGWMDPSINEPGVAWRDITRQSPSFQLQVRILYSLAFNSNSKSNPKLTFSSSLFFFLSSFLLLEWRKETLVSSILKLYFADWQSKGLDEWEKSYSHSFSSSKKFFFYFLMFRSVSFCSVGYSNLDSVKHTNFLYAHISCGWIGPIWNWHNGGSMAVVVVVEVVHPNVGGEFDGVKNSTFPAPNRIRFHSIIIPFRFKSFYIVTRRLTMWS